MADLMTLRLHLGRGGPWDRLGLHGDHLLLGPVPEEFAVSTQPGQPQLDGLNND